MTFEEALKLVDEAIFAHTKRHLKDVELIILQGSCQGQKYDEIAKAHGYTAKYLKQDIGPKLWKLVSEAIGEKVSKTNFQAALERRRSQLEAVPQSLEPILFYSRSKVDEKTLPRFVEYKNVMSRHRKKWVFGWEVYIPKHLNR